MYRSRLATVKLASWLRCIRRGIRSTEIVVEEQVVAASQKTLLILEELRPLARNFVA